MGVGIRVLRRDSQARSGFLSPPDVLPPWLRCKGVGLGQPASEEPVGHGGFPCKACTNTSTCCPQTQA